jgi:hypothetical protein
MNTSDDSYSLRTKDKRAGEYTKDRHRKTDIQFISRGRWYDLEV